MEEVSTIGLDLAKQVFQVHGANGSGVPLFNRKLRRAEVLRFFQKLPPCLVGMEACASSHHWAREISALGHDVRLIPPQYVKPFVKRGKTDAADAEAIEQGVETLIRNWSAAGAEGRWEDLKALYADDPSFYWVEQGRIAYSDYASVAAGVDQAAAMAAVISSSVDDFAVTPLGADVETDAEVGKAFDVNYLNKIVD